MDQEAYTTMKSKTKIKFAIDIVLIVAAIAALVYNLVSNRAVYIFPAIVAVCGTVAYLVRDIYDFKKDSQE
jgi:hypothetical protein